MDHKLTHGVDNPQVVVSNLVQVRNNLVQDHSNSVQVHSNLAKDQVEACQISSNLKNKEWKDLQALMAEMANKQTHGAAKLQVVEVLANTKEVEEDNLVLQANLQKELPKKKFLAQLILLMRNIKENTVVFF